MSSSSYVCKAIIEAPRSAERRHGLREIVVGSQLNSVSDIEALWATMYHQTNRYGRRGAAVHAISGVDLALWDLLGKHEGRPVYELLGGLVCPRVRAYASMLFGATPEATAALARGARADGLTACKFGWGPFGADPAVDIAHVRAARDALGPDIELMVDAGCK
jgi:L-rhamnonate dehydratase